MAEFVTAADPSPADPFENLQACDGYHVVLVQTSADVSVACVSYAGGEPYSLTDVDDPEAAAREVASWPEVTNETIGEARRLQAALDSIARYLNLGGSWNELEHGLHVLRSIAPGGLVFPSYYLYDSYVASDGSRQHIFVRRGTQDAVLWEESVFSSVGSPIGGFIEHRDLAELEEEQLDDVWQKAEEAEDAPDVPGDLPRLSGPQDPERKD